MFKNILLVGTGGFFGAIARYLIALVVVRFWKHDFPLGTFLINITGSFVLGLFMTYEIERAGLGQGWRELFAIGFVGAYTTFSTFEYETNRLIEGQAFFWAAANVIGSVLIGLAAVRLGAMLARV